MTCVMNANMGCEKCRRKVYEVLIKITGAYSIDIDAEQATVKVSGKVNPKIILQVLEGKHAKVKSVKFDGEAPSMGGGYPPPPYAMGPYPYPYPYPYPIGGPYDYPMMIPPFLLLPPPPPPPTPLPPPSSSVAAQPQRQTTPQLEAPPQNSGAAAPPTTTAIVAKEAVIPSDKKSKRCDVKHCSIM